ncbi:hypothetical protein LIER_37908 [Lithospermum erythrorhizon]|uniref:DUF7815 domain-containing protein n=1 Tax=Lithospermum erythrorhizon TaxID=34254 RepID=A0AAV3PTB6_LITER
MADSIIDEIQIWTREQAEYSAGRLSQVPEIPSLSGNIAALDDNNTACKHCKGRLLGGLHSLICIYCARLNDSSFPPLPIFFKDTIAYSWLLHSLNLHGSEMVEPHAEKNETARGQGAPPNKERLSLSELLNFQISFRAESDKVESDVKNKEFEQRNSFTLWNGIELDDFFLESERETSSSMFQVQFEGTKPVATDDNPYSFQTSSASNSFEDHELSGWQADFQPADNGVQNTSHLSGTSAPPSVDLSTHLDSVFGSGKDSKDEILITSDELRNNVSSKAFPQSLDFDFSQSGSNNQMQNKVEKTSTSGDWFQAGDWGTNIVDQPHKAITTDDDNSFAEWNDFTSSTNLQDTSGCVFAESNIPGAISHEKPSDLFSFDDQHNDMDVSGFGRSDLFSDPFSKNDEKLELNNISGGVSSSKRLADLTSVEDGSEHSAVNVEYSNARTNTTEDVQALVSQMHDLSFMLKDDLTVPTKSADSHNSSL